MSALLSSWSAVWPGDGDRDADAGPDGDLLDDRTAIVGGDAASAPAAHPGSAARHRPVACRSAASSTRTANSSPPSRATLSISRTARPDALADRDQQPVADGVAAQVVDGLEVVEVQEQQRDGLTVPVAGQRVRDAVDEQRPIGETREAVVERLRG